MKSANERFEEWWQSHDGSVSPTPRDAYLEGMKEGISLGTDAALKVLFDALFTKARKGIDRLESLVGEINK